MGKAGTRTGKTGTSMNISLTLTLERLVLEQVESGMYHSASEVVREALRQFFGAKEVVELSENTGR